MSGLSYTNPEPNELTPNEEEGPQSSLIDVYPALADPFSDLSLFLSEKIKREIEASGLIDQWSGKTEANLLAKILPEFEQKFPKYQLDTSALKTMWEKVSYCYEKIHGKKEAFLSDGQLNLKFLIRESLRSLPSTHPMPPYLLAKQHATKVSEYIATIEGKRPDLKHLTKVVWSVQKHLLKNLSSMNAKIPHEEYVGIDKLIVKTLLEILSKGQNLKPKILKDMILEEFYALKEIQSLSRTCHLYSSLSMILAKKLHQTSLISCHFSLLEKQKIERFIRHQVELSQRNQTLSSDAHRLELVQRILSLYAVAQELPKNMTENILHESVREIRAQIGDNQNRSSKEINHALFIFINAEMHLIDDTKCFEHISDIENKITQAYQKAVELPYLPHSKMELVELLIWKIIDEQEHPLNELSSESLRVMEKELGNVLIDNPSQSFKEIVNSALQFFKHIQKEDLSIKNVEAKIELWVLQNDMLTRWTHFDPKNPLLNLLKKLWKRLQLTEEIVNHTLFINHALKCAQQAHPSLQSFKEETTTRLWILYKYLWYTSFSEGHETTYERFLIWHHADLKHKHPECSKSELDHHLQKLAHHLIPLAPFTPKCH